MNLFFIVLIFCFLVFLYAVYFLSHDDFVILRENVSMEKIFNSAFIFAIVSLFFGRLIYVIFHPSSTFYNLLGFLLFPYFPGLSLAGAILGGFLFIYIYLKFKKLPVGRLFDFFSIGFLIAYPIGFLGFILLSDVRLSLNVGTSFLIILLLLFVFIKYLLPFSLSGKLKDGSLGMIFLISVSGVSFLANTILNKGVILKGDNVIFLLITFLSLAPLIKQEGYEWYQNYLRRR